MRKESKKMRLLQGSFLALCLIASTMAKPSSNSDNDTAVRVVSEGTSRFGANLFREVTKGKQENFICSPLSVATVLSMAAFGSEGNTKKEFQDVLGLPQDDNLAKNGYRSLTDELNSVKDVDLKVANKVFVAKQFSMKPTYQQMTEDVFRSSSEALNFAGEPEQSANVINTWCSQQTNNRIKSIVTSDELTPDTAMVLANAVYFKGNWKDRFNANLTSDRPFHVDAQTTKDVPTMYRNGRYRYADLPELDAKLIELPYKGDEFVMVVILPNKVDGLAELERKLENENLSNLTSRSYELEVDLYLPKFKIESTIPLNEPLKNMGLKDMFSSQANFSGVSGQPLYVSKVLQKAFIEVNEEGSEAAAVTVVGVAAASAIVTFVEPPTIRVDRPFNYAIYSRKHKVALFSGHVYVPEK